MKRLTQTMLALVAMLLCATHANAQQVTYQGVVYQILNTTDCAIVGLASSNKDATELVFNGDGIPDGGDSYSRKITQVNIQAFDSKSLKKVDMSKPHFQYPLAHSICMSTPRAGITSTGRPSSANGRPPTFRRLRPQHLTPSIHQPSTTCRAYDRPT